MTDDFGLFDTDTAPPSAGRDDERAEKKPELVYGSPEEFLHEQLLPTYVRSVTGKSGKWCIEWCFHPEADSRADYALNSLINHVALRADVFSTRRNVM